MIDKVIRVLVVDDSAFVRKMLKQMISQNPFMEVVGIASNGEEALEKVDELKPDVVTLDLIMPQLDGIGFLKKMKKRKPIPVVIVSIASESGDLALQALDLGAVDFVQKPTALATDKINEISGELISKIKVAASVSLKHLEAASSFAASDKPLPRLTAAGNVDLVVIGISTGGPQALKTLIPMFPSDFPVPIAMVLHMPIGYTELYAQKLNEISSLKVTEAREGEEIETGKVLLAPAGRHLTFRRSSNGKVVTHLDTRPFDTLHRPSVDVLFTSAADVFGGRVLGVVMTGMGSDGKEGSKRIRAEGGRIYTESEETCIVYGMPRSVDEAGLSDLSVPLNKMAGAIMEAL